MKECFKMHFYDFLYVTCVLHSVVIIFIRFFWNSFGFFERVRFNLGIHFLKNTYSDTSFWNLYILFLKILWKFFYQSSRILWAIFNMLQFLYDTNRSWVNMNLKRISSIVQEPQNSMCIHIKKIVHYLMTTPEFEWTCQDPLHLLFLQRQQLVQHCKSVGFPSSYPVIQKMAGHFFSLLLRHSNCIYPVASQHENWQN